MLNVIKNKFLSACVAATEFKNSEKGVTAVEYAVVIAGVTMVVLFIFGTNGPVKSMLSNIFSTVSSKVTSAVNSGL